MKPFKLSVYEYFHVTENYDLFKIGEFNTIKECISFAKKYARIDSYFKTFKWDDFDQISHHFDVAEYREEMIGGLKSMEHYASANLEEIMYEGCENLDMFVK